MFFFTSKKVKKICAVCGREFQARPDAKTCSNACRERLYRQRKLSRLVVEKIRSTDTMSKC